MDCMDVVTVTKSWLIVTYEPTSPGCIVMTHHLVLGHTVYNTSQLLQAQQKDHAGCLREWNGKKMWINLKCPL